ncbi:hypothetical protein HDV02_005998 [Globomyces sp. JEL0801]|nr:hypothetical protein HDV02_005998 [Globomyces sp. JEL0801]
MGILAQQSGTSGPGDKTASVPPKTSDPVTKTTENPPTTSNSPPPSSTSSKQPITTSSAKTSDSPKSSDPVTEQSKSTTTESPTPRTTLDENGNVTLLPPIRTSTTPTSDSNNSEGGGLSSGVVTFLIVGGIILGIMMIGLGFLYFNRISKKNPKTDKFAELDFSSVEHSPFGNARPSPGHTSPSSAHDSPVASNATPVSSQPPAQVYGQSNLNHQSNLNQGYTDDYNAYGPAIASNRNMQPVPQTFQAPAPYRPESPHHFQINQPTLMYQEAPRVESGHTIHMDDDFVRPPETYHYPSQPVQAIYNNPSATVDAVAAEPDYSTYYTNPPPAKTNKKLSILMEEEEASMYTKDTLKSNLSMPLNHNEYDTIERTESEMPVMETIEPKVPVMKTLHKDDVPVMETIDRIDGTTS